MTYSIATAYLDEAGHVYIPALGPDGGCVKLGLTASAIWRSVAATGLPPISITMTGARAEFLQMLLERGVIEAN